MRYFKGLVAALAATAFSLGGQASQHTDDDWHLTRDSEFRGEIKTWDREIPGQQLKAFRGRMDVPYTQLEVMAVLADIENFPRWVFQCKNARHYRDLGDDVVYIRIAGIWPVDDRDVITRTRINQDPKTRAITIHTWAEDDLLDTQEKAVRMPEFENLFILEPKSDGWTRITFQTYADPGGAIPDWLANFVSTRAPYETLRDMKKRLKKRQYHIRDWKELPFSLPGIETMVFSNRRPRG